MPSVRSRADLPESVTVGLERPDPAELGALFVAVGWGGPSSETLRTSIAAYTATVCARTPDGTLAGYASIFSDRVLSTMLGEFVVHPEYRRRGVGRAMMRAVEREFPRAPIYVQALGAARGFFEALGFRASTTPMACLFRRPNASPPAPAS